MKKILLASTILVGTAGFAAAQGVSVSGSAFMGVEYTDPAGLGIAPLAWYAKNSVQLDYSASGETDGGLMFGFDGTIFSTTHWANGTATATTSDHWYNHDFTTWISGDFGKVSLTSTDGVQMTLAYSHTIDAFSIDVAYDVDSPAWDVELGYAFGDYSVYIGHDTSTAVTRAGGAATFGDFSVYLDLNDIGAVVSTNWEVGADWTSGAITVGGDIGMADTNGTPASSESYFDLNFGYDLGGGASVIAEYGDPDTATAADETITLGVSMEF